MAIQFHYALKISKHSCFMKVICASYSDSERKDTGGWFSV